MKFLFSVATSISVLGLLSTAALAQEQTWLNDRRYREGIGIRVGDLELHPGIAGEFGYDSNYFRRGDSDRQPPAGSLRLRITPSFSLATLSPQRRGATPDTPPPDFEFRADLSATYNEFFPVSGSASDRSNLHDQRNVGGTLGLRLDIAPKQTWSGAVFGTVGRAISPTNEGVPSQTFNRINAGGGGELVYRPGGGLLEWGLGYTFSGIIFEEISELTNLTHEANTRGRWRFLPRTALLYDARFGFVSFPSAGTNSRAKTASHPVRARLGATGLITPSFSATVMGGWGASFYTGLLPNEQEDFDSFLGQVELKWFLKANAERDVETISATASAIALGFKRDFSDSYIGTYYASNRGYANFAYFFGGRFLLTAEAGASANMYPSIPAYSQSAFTDLRIDSTLFGEYRFRDSIGLNATVKYGTNISSTTLSTVDAAGTTVTEDLQWQEIEAYLGLRWFM